MARRHVAEAEARVTRQRALLRELRRDGYPTQLAEQLLTSLVQTTEMMRAHLHLLERKTEEG